MYICLSAEGGEGLQHFRMHDQLKTWTETYGLTVQGLHLENFKKGQGNGMENQCWPNESWFFICFQHSSRILSFSNFLITASRISSPSSLRTRCFIISPTETHSAWENWIFYKYFLNKGLTKFLKFWHIMCTSSLTTSC